ncbi:MAG: dephospho-CoA kinase [Candidatus Omnitrophica bacterium]|nr:dephospho-CoA kinase [Candidatus Omnitrophota bacterium]
MKKKFIIGITGGFGTGKSTVSKFFKKMGADIIDADKLAHEAIKPNGGAYKKVVTLFSASVLKADRTIDRKRLGRVVFGSSRKLAILNSIVHPEVIKKINAYIGKRKKGIFIIDAPLLIEAGLLNIVDKLIVVTASRKRQIARCRSKLGLTASDINRRIRSQMPLKRKRCLADFLIDNNGTKRNTERKVKRIWQQIKKLQTK